MADAATRFTDAAFTTPAVNDGDALGGRKDKSGNGNHATAAGTARPLLKLNQVNGLPSCRWDGANTALTIANSGIALQSLTYVAVLSMPAAAQTLFGGLTGCPELYSGGAGNLKFEDSGRSTIVNSNGSIGLSTWVIISVRYDGTNGEILKNHATYQTGVNARAFIANFATLGNGVHGHWAGDTAEEVAYNVRLSDADLLTVLQFFATQYGVTLS